MKRRVRLNGRRDCLSVELFERIAWIASMVSVPALLIVLYLLLSGCGPTIGALEYEDAKAEGPDSVAKWQELQEYRRWNGQEPSR